MSIDALKRLLGPGGYIDDPADMAPYLTEWRDRWHGDTPLVARPRDTPQVAAIVAHCAAAGIKLVPQGGHTGLCGGAMPHAGAGEVVVSLGRMNRVRAVDPEGFTMTLEAGVVLAAAQQAAVEADRLFPLSLSSEGSAQIGGVLSTNAGGNAVLRYGNARDLVLGLEVVLADGRVWNGLRGLRKDNTGYDLKQLFLGAEGTLGIITAAVLKLFPAPRQQETALVAVPDVEAAIRLLSLAREASGDRVSSFELIPRLGLEFVVNHMPGNRDPLTSPSPWYVLIDLTTAAPGTDLQGAMQSLLERALERGLVADAAVARSVAQRADLWRLRESLSESQKYEGGSIKHDVSVPIARIPEFIRKATRAVELLIPGIRAVPFGHMGDGNIHFNLSQPLGIDRQVFLDRWEQINVVVHDIVAALEGSISAEHGVGQLKVDEIVRYKSPVEMELMRRIKRAMDPDNILNPGKLVTLSDD
ncbi:FAD-binding oxidoreductase [Emcibacter sp. SYSU 3D8]|uniref:FAD-binding oxidoreductase n=1 Tax=Emcibacter sp. SYSU 3D8 TaxID=3133969 RepID=UPI0031FEE60C